MIGACVGRNSPNRPNDVRAVQRLLNANLSRLTPLRPVLDDGICSPLTVLLIEEFQRRVVRLSRPDGRVDPGGRTLALLTGAGQPEPTAQSDVIYSPRIGPRDKIVAPYTMDVIRLALRRTGMQKAVMTSTIRRPEEQATIMYTNAVQNVADQYRLYGSMPGSEVIKVFEQNRSEARETVIALMVQKIVDLGKEGKRVSKHVVTPEAYKLLNIVDIGVNSTRNANPHSFNMSGFTSALRGLEREGFIDKFIDETAKSNHCWHIEVKPGRRMLPA